MANELSDKKPNRGQTIKNFVGSMVDGFNNIGRKITKAEADASRRGDDPNEWTLSSKSFNESDNDN